MRCSHCGGLMHHIITGNGGINYYQCTQMLTGFRRDGSRKGGFYSCDTIQDERGRVIPPGSVIAYLVEGKPELLKVGGRENG